MSSRRSAHWWRHGSGRNSRAVGVQTRIYVPDRLAEGYGPNREAMGTMRDEGLSLVVLVDCGTASFEPLGHAREMGLECVVVDHHVAEARLPPAFAVVNPSRLDESAGGAVLGGLAAVGVTFLLLVALNRILRRRGFHAGRAEPDLRRWLDLTALGTVADVAELAGVNRTLVSRGIDVLGRRGNPGIAALLDTAKVRDRPDSWHAGFVLGPRINAGGRIGDAGLGAALLASDDPDFAWRTAETLERLNVERREVEAEVLEAALRSSVPQPDDPYVFAAGGDWHPGVVGIVASRLVERFGRPALVASGRGWRSPRFRPFRVRRVLGADHHRGAPARTAVVRVMTRHGGGVQARRRQPWGLRIVFGGAFGTLGSPRGRAPDAFHRRRPDRCRGRRDADEGTCQLQKKSNYPRIPLAEYGIFGPKWRVA